MNYSSSFFLNFSERKCLDPQPPKPLGNAAPKKSEKGIFGLTQNDLFIETI